MTSNDVIKKLKANNLLRVIDSAVDIDLEIAHIAYIEVKKESSKSLLFTNVVSKRLNKKFETPVLINLFSSFEVTNLFFKKHPDDIAKEIEELLHLSPPTSLGDKFGMLGKLFSMKDIFPKRLSKKGVSQECELNSLYDIPVLKTWEEDAGAFITMGQVYTKSLDGKMNNLGMYRLQVHSDNTLGMHWQIHKDSASFFDDYKKAGIKMPVAIGLGGDPLLTWSATAPMPKGMFELLMYGFVTKKGARLVKCLSNDLYVPEEADYIIEGFVDPSISKIEGPFGDHTGYYTLADEYPVLDVTKITSKKDPVYYATVVGKPPLEDKYMGWPTERIFLPLLKTTAPELIDYKMPENGVYHNLLLASIDARYPGHAKQFMHTFWGVGQMSFVKHAIFVGNNAPKLDNYDELSTYILNRISNKNILISEGICDALDHASEEPCISGKLGIDATGDEVECIKDTISDEELKSKLSIDGEFDIRQFKTDTYTPITTIFLENTKDIKETFDKIKKVLSQHTRFVVFLDLKDKNMNEYMLVWRVVNNIDVSRDWFNDTLFGLDATSKIHGQKRVWPKDTNCTKEVIQSLRKRNLIDVDDEFLEKFGIVE
ncbi:MAG: UbiD family decarboxylase associated with menaquinone via futalosine [uncultured Campylobacterales bacterium]|uniref:UbiD family decarboxylase associated with menaquinone via futalosine n=1 Tax=uncultured Campylobacterales bacterium TaxID=352960 RepID=A0A6S6RUH1_9BACT|nr:MAG: UbiD family decarboxylase associated with menaquinone via futalosine [uncultured Campylobacterales bacterium]